MGAQARECAAELPQGAEDEKADDADENGGREEEGDARRGDQHDPRRDGGGQIAAGATGRGEGLPLPSRKRTQDPARE